MKNKRVLIIGSGGREHALGWKIKQSPFVKKIYFAPGNGGTLNIGENIKIGVTDIKRLLEFAKEKKVDLTIVGPEIPLAEGIVDTFQEKGMKIFGPTKKAARLEWDKDWAARFMEKYAIPHPQSYSFTSVKKAMNFLRTADPRKIVIKASGLAAGKGVLLPNLLTDAKDALERIMVKKEFGAAGDTVVIQERLSGMEVSVIALSDGKTVIPMLPSQDHKRVFDDDEGPNTGGMGAFAPVPFVTGELMNKITQTILQPTIDGMKKEGIPFIGVLYAGLMMTKDGPKVLEYNCRFGDPETQPLMMMLQSDLLEHIRSCLLGTLHTQKITFNNGAAICVVLAAKGYPGKYQKGEIIHGVQKPYRNSVQAFHSGTKLYNGTIVTDGGRVLGITANADSYRKARDLAYNTIGERQIYFNNMHYRKDIGMQALKI